MRLIYLLSLVCVSASAFAAPKSVKNFEAGLYLLTSGPADKCEAGEFTLREDGKGVQLGPQHGFNMATSNVVLNSDIPEEKDCVYDVREKADASGKTTTFSFAETLRCPGNVRHILNRTAKISPGRVIIDVDQKGNPEFGEDELTFKYRCVFNKK